MNTATQRALRTIAQLIVSGGFTALTNQLVDGMDPATAASVLAVYQIVVTFVQNYAEDAGWIKPMLKDEGKS